MSYWYKMYANGRNATCETTWGSESRKYGLPPDSGFEAELRGGAEAVRDLGQRQSAASLFGARRAGPKAKQKKLPGGHLLDCPRAKRKGRKAAMNNGNRAEETTHN